MLSSFHFNGKDDISGFVLDLICEAAELALYFRNSVKPDFISEKGSLDFVTAADFAVEKQIMSKIQSHFPSDIILGEESGLKNPRCAAKAAHTAEWIIDPIDGTFNFLRGLPEWGVCIARLHQGVLTHGAIAFPELNILAVAQKDAGAWSNGRRLQSARPELCKERLVALGYNPSKLATRRYGELITDLIDAEYEYRRHGAACFGLYSVAAGWCDAFFETSLNAWDACAGLLLVLEAGGHNRHLPIDQFVLQRGPVAAYAHQNISDTLQPIFQKAINPGAHPDSGHYR